MNDFIVFDTEAEALAWCAKLDAKLGYPNPKTRTERYTAPTLGDDGRWYVPTNPDCPSAELGAIDGARKLAAAVVALDDSGRVVALDGVPVKKETKGK